MDEVVDNVDDVPKRHYVLTSRIGRFVDDKIRCTYSDKELYFRSRAASGVWMCVLIPISLSTGAIFYPQFSITYGINTIISIGLCLLSIFDLFYCLQHDDTISSPSTNNDSNNNNNSLRVRLCRILPFRSLGYVATYVSISVSLIRFYPSMTAYNIFCGLYVVNTYRCLFLQIVRECPRSFTYGEATVVSQATIIFIVSFVTNIVQTVSTTITDPTSVSHHSSLYGSKITFIAQCVVFAVLATITFANKIFYLRRPLPFIAIVCTSVFLFVAFLPWLLMRENIVLWTYRLVASDYRTLLLLGCWLVCSLFAVLGVMLQIKTRTKASTIVRKYFHAIVVIVYVSGLFVNATFLYFASVVAFAVLTLLETIRLIRMPLIGECLQNGFVVYADEQDEGPLALTPFYLLVGCSLPLWLYPAHIRKPLPLPTLAGIITVGIGDTSASVIGRLFGSRKWPGTNKTIEGSVGSFALQLACIIILAATGEVEIRNVLYAAAAIAFATIVEAKTEQIDNLVLPLIAYPLFYFVNI